MTSNLEIKQRPDILVFSHLRWDSVTQRPQHILNLLSQKRRILFVEEPIEFATSTKDTANIYKVNKNITILQPRVGSVKESDILVKLIKSELKKQNFAQPLIWFYSPQFINLSTKIDHQAVVYDCMDELSGFVGAPPDLKTNEKKLLTLADIVFTGGKSIYESKKVANSNTYCFPSSVDAKHFKSATLPETIIPGDISHLPRPIVGYYGVIDERIDYDLLDYISKAMPQVSFVMIGPFAKVDPTNLPKNPNLFYLGKKSYVDLPNYLKAFDIAMMPFAQNSATKYISPTKTLEYMAGEKLIVSTPIKDVERDYNHVVSIANTYDKFVKAINMLLKLDPETKSLILKLQNDIVTKTSWKNTVKAMEKLLIGLNRSNRSKLKTSKDLITSSL